MERLIHTVAQLASAGFAGGCLYLSVVQLPVLAAATPAEGFLAMRSMLPRMGALMAPLLLLGCVSSGYWALHVARGVPAGWASATSLFAVALLAALLVTVFVHLPLNAEYLGPQIATEQRANVLLTRWSSWHHVRTTLAIVGLVAAVWSTSSASCKASTSITNSDSISIA
jgi:uncharacterized membrane protein